VKQSAAYLEAEEISGLSKTLVLFISWTHPIFGLALIDNRGEHMLVTNPKLCPFLSTIITPNNVISAITDMIDWNNSNVVWYTYALFIDSGSSRVASFILYKLTHVQLNQLSNDMAELKSFLSLFCKYLRYFLFSKEETPV
jgi:hypothetical protein